MRCYAVPCGAKETRDDGRGKQCRYEGGDRLRWSVRIVDSWVRAAWKPMQVHKAVMRCRHFFFVAEPVKKFNLSAGLVPFVLLPTRL